MKSRRRKVHELEARLEYLMQRRAWGWRTEEERDSLGREIERLEAQIERIKND